MCRWTQNLKQSIDFTRIQLCLATPIAAASVGRIGRERLEYAIKANVYAVKSGVYSVRVGLELNKDTNLRIWKSNTRARSSIGWPRQKWTETVLDWIARHRYPRWVTDMSMRALPISWTKSFEKCVRFNAYLHRLELSWNLVCVMLVFAWNGSADVRSDSEQVKRTLQWHDL